MLKVFVNAEDRTHHTILMQDACTSPQDFLRLSALSCRPKSKASGAPTSFLAYRWQLKLIHHVANATPETKKTMRRQYTFGIFWVSFPRASKNSPAPDFTSPTPRFSLGQDFSVHPRYPTLSHAIPPSVLRCTALALGKGPRSREPSCSQAAEATEMMMHCSSPGVATRLSPSQSLNVGHRLQTKGHRRNKGAKSNVDDSSLHSCNNTGIF